MFREMRRNAQQLSVAECEKILISASSGVLSVRGDEGYPYSVPLSFVYDSGKIYFHSAVTGHKIDAIKNNGKVSFCVISQDEVHPEEFTTHYKSVVIFGRARIIEVKEDILRTITLLSDKYCPEMQSKNEIDGAMGRFCMVEIEIEHMTGKQAKELI